MYRMPTHFGPRTGPRQGPDGRTFANVNSPKTTTISVSYLTNQSQLQGLLPERFEVAGEPVVTIAARYMKDIEWLAGRGYNALGVSFPATFRGDRDEVTGSFLAVLWENLTDPILTGREELGYAKIYCELPEPEVDDDGSYHLTASWLGFKFLDIHVQSTRKRESPEVENQTGAGLLHYKYIPRTGDWGQADVAYATLTPAGNTLETLVECWTGDGDVQFHAARWEDMPTQYNIVNTLRELEIMEYRATSITSTVGGKDLSDQRILR